MQNETPRTIPFGIRVKLNSHNVVKESQGRHGTTLDPMEYGDGWIKRMIEDNPHFNLVLLDGDTRPIYMEDRSLDLVEFLDRCYVCEEKGGYIVYAPCSDGVRRSFCIDCHERNRSAIVRLPGYGMGHTPSECPDPGVCCFPEQKFSGDEQDSLILDGVRSRSWREDFHADG